MIATVGPCSGSPPCGVRRIRPPCGRAGPTSAAATSADAASLNDRMRTVTREQLQQPNGMTYADTVVDLVGDTPLVRLHQVAEGVAPLVLAKIEYFNPGGSVKD